jgi:hypothetical protein
MRVKATNTSTSSTAPNARWLVQHAALFYTRRNMAWQRESWSKAKP